MKFYKELAELSVFTFNEASKIIGNNSLTANNLSALVKNGSVKRIKRNLYTCIDFSTRDGYANRFEVASKITDVSFISYHSAFEFYGLYNQVYFDIQVCSSKRFSDFEYNGYHYKGYLSNSIEQVNLIKGVRVTSIERTIVDSINMLGKVMDAEELVKCLDLVHYVDENKILSMLRTYDKEILYRKVGYVLSFYKDEFNLSDHFFEECKNKGTISNKGSLVLREKEFLEFNSEWGLYAYKNLRNLVSKGGQIDV